MIKYIYKSASIFMLAFSMIFIYACKKESTGAGTQDAPKVLNKSTLTPKKWYSQGSSVILDFQAGGVFGTMNGSWKWKSSNSDTLEIVTQSGFPPIFWKIYWNTETEMSGERIGNNTATMFKNEAW